ncbi:hypothetical protein, partial [Helicobacter japonicus]|uniref:hypothetical protein n=1 Tax=Helicobacter japonicus TaxID=425400 RepID=UPI0030134314
WNKKIKKEFVDRIFTHIYFIIDIYRTHFQSLFTTLILLLESSNLFASYFESIYFKYANALS